MSYPMYEEYKDVSDSMLEEVPKNWGLMKIKHVVDTKISDGPHETPPLKDFGVPFLSAEAVKNNRLDFSKKRGFITEELHKQYCKKIKPQKDDLFIVKSGATTGNIAKAETNEEFSIWSPLALIRTNLKAYSEFTYYYLQSVYFRTQVELNWSFGTQQNIGMGVIENLFMPMPPITDQKQIATFLDRETQKIDCLIEKQQRLIKLLREKRKAVISHAVTKGINPNTKMKDSGVEWVGEIPEHWEVKKGGYLGKILTSPSLPDKYIHDVGNVFYVKVNDLNQVDSSFILLDTKNKACIDEVSVSTISDFICFPKRGAAIFTNKACIVRHPSLLDPNLMGWKIFEKYNQCYVIRLLLTRRLDDLADVSTVPQINNKHIEPEKFPCPPIQEQTDIVDFLERKIVMLDDLIDKAGKAIELLKERRTALISAAITGKIDVRNIANG